MSLRSDPCPHTQRNLHGPIRPAVASALALALLACSTPEPPLADTAPAADEATPRGARLTLAMASRSAFRRREVGVASWYGGKFHGRTTANGERYNMHGMTAAHRTLQFGTVVRVTNLANRRTVTLRINDRGPFIKNRIIDVSRGAAARLGLLETGVARVRVEVVRSPRT